MASKLCPMLLRTAIRAAPRAPRPQIRAFTAAAVRRSDSLMVHRNTPDNNPEIPFKFTAQNEAILAEILKRYPRSTRRPPSCRCWTSASASTASAPLAS
ncbi:NADH-ubiquinone oxidoreductase [Apiospora arundinis]